jgi:hypothetical protein
MRRTAKTGPVSTVITGVWGPEKVSGTEQTQRVCSVPDTFSGPLISGPAAG